MLNEAFIGSGIGIAGFSALAYRAAPGFWQQFSKEIGRAIIPAPGRPDPNLWPDQGLHAAWLGHSTVLIKADGFVIITDPVFSNRVGLNLGPMTVGLKRLVEPAEELINLPHADLLLLSHAHMDHFDLPSLRALQDPKTSVVTAAGTRDLLRRRTFKRIHELRWNETCQVGPATIKAFQVNHWGARVRTDTWRGFNGYLVEVGRYRFIFGGDTAFTDTFRGVRTAKRVDLAIMPIGAYNPWIRVHCNPEQALSMATHAGSEFILPVHHQTFVLGREPAQEPILRLLTAAGSSPDRVCVQNVGDEFHLS